MAFSNPVPPAAPRPPRIQVYHVNGVWRVTKHGRFYGDFLKEQHASSAGDEAAGIAAPLS